MLLEVKRVSKKFQTGAFKTKKFNAVEDVSFTLDEGEIFGLIGGMGKKHAKERGVNVTFIKSEGENMPFDDDTFDLLVNCRVLWTLTQPEVSLKEWKRVLKHGGCLLGFMRAHTDEPTDWNAYDGKLESPFPLRNASKEIYTKHLEKAGYGNYNVIDMDPKLTVKKEGKNGKPMQPWECVYGEKTV